MLVVIHDIPGGHIFQDVIAGRGRRGNRPELAARPAGWLELELRAFGG